MNIFKIANPLHVTKIAFGLTGATLRLTGELIGTTAKVLFPGHSGVPQHAVTAQTAVDTDPVVVLEDLNAPADPPVDVVGQALAAEEAAPLGEENPGVGLVHEPRGASRGEEHGEVELQRAELDAITEGALDVLDQDREDSVPDHLTAPLLDPAEAEDMFAQVTGQAGDDR